MKLYYEDLKSEGHWFGHKIKVEGKGVPRLHLKLCGPAFFKLCYEKETLFWAKQQHRDYGVAILKTLEYEPPIDPIPSSELEKRKGLKKAQWLESWSRYFIQELQEKPEELFYRGQWVMSAHAYSPSLGCYEPFVKNDFGHSYIYGVSVEEGAFQQVDLFGGDEKLVSLKKVNPHSGRLKWWRKNTRQNLLPPVVISYISGLVNYVILDGHYRLKAALLENHDIDLLVLRPLQEIVISKNNEKQKQAILKKIEENNVNVQKENGLLIRAYDDRRVDYISRSRVLPKSGENGVEEVSHTDVRAFKDRNWTIQACRRYHELHDDNMILVKRIIDTLRRS